MCNRGREHRSLRVLGWATIKAWGLSHVVHGEPSWIRKTDSAAPTMRSTLWRFARQKTSEELD